MSRAAGWRQKAETTRVPALVGSARTSTPVSGDTPVIRSREPAPSWASMPYVAGSGGKKASRAATDDVTLPILPCPLLPPRHGLPPTMAGRGWLAAAATAYSGRGRAEVELAGRNVSGWLAVVRAEFCGLVSSLRPYEEASGQVEFLFLFRFPFWHFLLYYLTYFPFLYYYSVTSLLCVLPPCVHN